MYSQKGKENKKPNIRLTKICNRVGQRFVEFEFNLRDYFLFLFWSWRSFNRSFFSKGVIIIFNSIEIMVPFSGSFVNSFLFMWLFYSLCLFFLLCSENKKKSTTNYHKTKSLGVKLALCGFCAKRSQCDIALSGKFDHVSMSFKHG